MEVERNNKTPLYVQLEEEIRNKIENGILKPGQQVPSESILQEKYGMSRVTVRRAISDLEAEGLLEKIQGKGTYVSDHEFLSAKIASFTSLYESLGKKVETVIISAGISVGTDQECKFLEIPNNSQVLSIYRLRKINGLPVVLEINVMSLSYVKLLQFDLTQSLHKLLVEKLNAIPYRKSQNRLKIVYADEDMAEKLGVLKDQALIHIEREVWNDKGEPLYKNYDIARTDRPDVFEYLI